MKNMDILKAIRRNDMVKVEKILKKGYHKHVNEAVSDNQESIPIKTIPLCLATARGSFRIIKVLLQYGADLTASNADWASPIHLAVYRGYDDLVSYFLSLEKYRDLIINSQDQLGDTPLHIATKSSKVEMVKVLLMHNCSLSILNNTNKTALDHAKETFGEYSDIISAAIVSKMRENAMATQKVLPPLPDGMRKLDLSRQTTPLTTPKTIELQQSAKKSSICSVTEGAPLDVISVSSSRSVTPLQDDDYDSNLMSPAQAEHCELEQALKSKEKEARRLEDEITMCEAEKNKIKADIIKLNEKVNQQSLLISKKQASKENLEQEIVMIKKKLKPSQKLQMTTNPSVQEKSYECPVCLEIPLPPKNVYQCSNGHIYCEDCRSMPNMHICSLCRVPLDKQNPIRNIAFTEIISTLFPTETNSS